jgi:hypothetical protein
VTAGLGLAAELHEGPERVIGFLAELHH